MWVPDSIPTLVLNNILTRPAELHTSTQITSGALENTYQMS